MIPPPPGNQATAERLAAMRPRRPSNVNITFHNQHPGGPGQQFYGGPPPGPSFGGWGGPPPAAAAAALLADRARRLAQGRP